VKRFKNILFYSNGKMGSRIALNRAFDLAKQNQGELTVVTVVEELPRDLLRLAAAMPVAELQNLAAQKRRERLESFVAPFRRKVAPLELEVLCGKPFMEIIRAVLHRGYDLVMLTAEGRSRLREMLFGSTSLHLLRKCPCPVWVIKPSRRQGISRILAAVPRSGLTSLSWARWLGSVWKAISSAILLRRFCSASIVPFLRSSPKALSAQST
jgi:universal stress protein E